MSPGAALCRDCGAIPPATSRCPACGSPRVVVHPELHDLAIAHVDCDAFYAAIEKRDQPALADRPVIVGGGRRGVVAAACYLARQRGVRSAMPMFKALAACPDAAVIRPDMAKYAATARDVRALLLRTTPLVEPVSIDEAFLDLSGTRLLHGCSPAGVCARLAGQIETRLGITVSFGLSYNKFLAKMASDLDKPRGFAVIGRADAPGLLAPRPVGDLWGVGRSLQRRLAADGIRTIGQLRGFDEAILIARYGAIGKRLRRFALGVDDRPVEPCTPAKSISAETTFEHDLSELRPLERALWPLCERVAERLKARDLGGRTVVLKLKTREFRLLTRSHRLPAPTQLADTLFTVARPFLAAEARGTAFRLIGIACADLVSGDRADPPDLLDATQMRRRNVEAAIDAVRTKLGRDAIGKGRGAAERLRGSPPPPRARAR